MKKDFTITKEQIITLNTDGNRDVRKCLNEWFPEAFKPFLEVGTWYKSAQFQKWNLYVTEVDNKLKIVKGFGFGADGSWMENALNDSWDFNELEKCVQMSEQEVYDALKNESHKRYKEGDYLKNHHGTWELKKLKPIYSDKYNNGIYNKQDSGKWLFLNGEWAEKIRTKTKSEAEKELNCKIID